ncbi:hypothetical protein K438DRAFT_1976806 [Mycena galopus ATCC 62051]|nr:hypothetical protein K438DRAFT_1976806 [Mycena galopus ATCC 62051]
MSLRSPTILNINQLANIADLHHVDADQSKPALKRAISLHVCAAACSNVGSLANFQYYGRDELAFETATLYDLMITAHSRATRITHLSSDKAKICRQDEHRATSQQYSHRNIAIFTQDVAALRAVLPPPSSEIHATISPEAGPGIESRMKVIRFLLRRNAFYISAGLQFSDSNLADIFPGALDKGVPQPVEICCLPDATLERKGYSDRGVGNTRIVPSIKTGGETIMEAVGYVVGERAAKDLRDMKACSCTVFGPE